MPEQKHRNGWHPCWQCWVLPTSEQPTCRLPDKWDEKGLYCLRHSSLAKITLTDPEDSNKWRHGHDSKIKSHLWPFPQKKWTQSYSWKESLGSFKISKSEGWLLFPRFFTGFRSLHRVQNSTKQHIKPCCILLHILVTSPTPHSAAPLPATTCTRCQRVYSMGIDDARPGLAS